MSDEWNTGLNEEMWDVRPKEKKRMVKGGCIAGVWENHYGDKFKEGDVITVKEWTQEYNDQSPAYTEDMKEYFQGAKFTIKSIQRMKTVHLAHSNGDNIGFTWHLDWLIPQAPPFEDELFEI